jgi:hypothetical protein
MTKPTYTLHSDSGHAWLEVPFKDLRAIGIDPERCFSECSYCQLSPVANGWVAYLEEDCDLGIFLHLYMATNNGERPLIKDRYQDGESFIRRLPRLPRGNLFEGLLRASTNYFKARYANAV